MPWMEICVMDERLGFVAACLDGAESISTLCRIFGISRKTGHKWQGRTVFVASALRGEPVGLDRIDDRSWQVRYGPLVLGAIPGESKMYRIAHRTRNRPKKQPNKPENCNLCHD